MENMTVPGWVQHHQAYPAIEDYRKTVPWNLDFACSVLGRKDKEVLPNGDECHDRKQQKSP